MKYYVFRVRSGSGQIELKKNKCVDGWSKSAGDCWQFSKQGATNIAKRMNSHNDGYEYGVISVDEWETILDFQAKANAISFEFAKVKGE